jgi:methionine-rich copper-binding protein CopC
VKLSSIARGVAVLGIAVLTVVPAAANTLVSTSPRSGATVKTAPSAITITTELPLMDAGNEIVVTDPSGARVDDGTLTIVNNEIVAGMKAISAPGVYKVTYSLLAENDVPLDGSYTFSYSTPVLQTPTAAPEPTTPGKIAGDNIGTSIFAIVLLLLAVVVTFALALYARRLYRDR